MIRINIIDVGWIATLHGLTWLALWGAAGRQERCVSMIVAGKCRSIRPGRQDAQSSFLDFIHVRPACRTMFSR